MTALIIAHAFVALLALGAAFFWVRVLERDSNEVRTHRGVARAPLMQDRQAASKSAIGPAPLRAAS